MPEYSKTAPLIEDTQTIDWLTKDYLKDILRKYKKSSNLEIIKYDIIPATSKGENYASILVRVKIEFKYKINDIEKTEIGNYIVKASFEGDEFATEKMLQYDVYNREMDIYKNIIPKLNTLLNQINDNDKLFAEIIYVDYDRTSIIFEDLSIKSYKLVDRLIGLDMLHAKIALRKLAKMHATTAVLNDNHEFKNKLSKNFNRGMFNRYTEAFSPFYVNTLEICGKSILEWDIDEYKIYGEKLLKLTPYVMEYGKRAFDVKDNHLNVLVHGDYWTNNIMFTYNNNDDDENNNSDTTSPKDAIIIDFQFSCWGSPTIDLHYFFNTSLKEELRLNHLDELLQYYYNILTHTLRALNYQRKIPTLHEFWLQYIEKSFYAVTSACLVQPIFLNENTADADFHALVGDDERARNFKRSLFKNPRVIQNLKTLLPIFDKKGLIDIQN